MKYDWLNAKRKPVPIDVIVDDEVQPVLMTPLRDTDIEAGTRAFQKRDGDTPEETKAKDEARAYFFAAVGLGRENFTADDPEGLAAELKAKGVPQRAEIARMVDALVARYTLTVEQIREAAKDSLRPIESEL